MSRGAAGLLALAIACFLLALLLDIVYGRSNIPAGFAYPVFPLLARVLLLPAIESGRFPNSPQIASAFPGFSDYQTPSADPI